MKAKAPGLSEKNERNAPVVTVQKFIAKKQVEKKVIEDRKKEQEP